MRHVHSAPMFILPQFPLPLKLSKLISCQVMLWLWLKGCPGFILDDDKSAKRKPCRWWGWRVRIDGKSLTVTWKNSAMMRLRPIYRPLVVYNINIKRCLSMTCLIPVHLGDIILRLGRIDDLQPLIEQQQQKHHPTFHILFRHSF